jgi:CBS domain-containing protein
MEEPTMKARDIMTPAPVTVSPTDTVAHAAEVMRDLRIGCVPVVDELHLPVLLGLLTDRDITVRCVARHHDPNCLVRNHMTSRRLVTVTPDADVSEIIQKMEFAQVRRIPVVTANNVLMGIIAQADLATKLGHDQPALVEEVVERISAPSAIGV